MLGQRERAARVLVEILPYEHPKRSAVKLGGDPNAPVNLSSLNDAEPAYFRRVMVKIRAPDGPSLMLSLSPHHERVAAQDVP